MQLTKK